MASHRKPGPPGARGTGIRTPVLATAALTSVAVLSQAAGAAPASASAPAGDARPSAEEIEKKIDELYRRADPEEEPAAVQRGRAETPHPEAVRRPGLFSKAREGLVPFTAAPETATSLLADFPDDHFAQSRLMNRLASRVKGASERGKPSAPAAADAPEAPEAPAAASYDVKTAKAAVQHKLATARALLTHLTAPVTAPDPAPAAAPARARALTPAGSSAPTPASAPAAEQARSAAPPVSVPPLVPPPLVPPAPVTKAEKAIAFARAQIGKPYVAGASGPGSYDCSGLTQAAWRAAGVTLPRAARDQAAMGTTVPLAEARPGDLVFFGDDSSHAGLLTGDGTMIHAPRPGAYVREEPVHLAGEPVVHLVVRPA
ncbi:C40 family peptidase [Streptomyces sp. NPDC004596]